jgi:hypothetical protein
MSLDFLEAQTEDYIEDSIEGFVELLVYSVSHALRHSQILMFVVLSISELALLVLLERPQTVDYGESLYLSGEI